MEEKFERMKNVKKSQLKLAGVFVIAVVGILAWQIMFTATGEDTNINVTAQQAYQLIQENQENSDFVVLDLRTPGELRYGVIKNAMFIDVMAPDFESKFKGLNKAKTYLILCMSGSRSNRFVKLMTVWGFAKLFHMPGGMAEWYRARLPTVSP